MNKVLAMTGALIEVGHLGDGNGNGFVLARDAGNITVFGLTSSEVSAMAPQWGESFTLVTMFDSAYQAELHAEPAARIAELEAWVVELTRGLDFYARGEHFTLHDADAWDTVSGEPVNFYEDEHNTATVEDGSVAKMALAGKLPANDDEEVITARPAAPAQPVPAAIVPVHDQNARWAIDGAITWGRMSINKPSDGHWLMEYWQIGQQLAELGKTSAWDNVTPITPSPAPCATAHTEQPGTREWQPIETAPKDGRTLLLGRFNELNKWRTMRGQWFTDQQIGEEWEEPEGFEAGWYETAVEPDCPNCWPTSPTHFQPLPPAPTGASHEEL